MEKMKSSNPTIFTVGHSTHLADRFLEIIKASGVTAIADVRSLPFSRFQPQFNRDNLEVYLKQNGISYVFLGKELGARSSDTSCFVSGRVQYRLLTETKLFQMGIERLLNGAKKHVIAVMCSEKEPLECHRTLLVGKALHTVGASVIHLHADGSQESHDAAMSRLVNMVGLENGDFFRSRDEILAEALRKQEERVAYVDEQIGNESDERTV
jgi:uncharacterized protein (DUF488 family)